MERQALLPFRTDRYDVAIVGAGPVGLALAIELARLGLTTLVVDRRPTLAHDARVRPQLLVARAGDLAHLRHLGLDLDDPRLVSWLSSRCERDLVSGRTVRGDVFAARLDVSAPSDLWALASQRPLALIPIGRLQHTLLARAVALGADVHYECDVVRLRRHARDVSLRCADGSSARATLAVIATGAARSLLSSLRRGVGPTGAAPQRLMGGVFAEGAVRGQWVRVEVPVPGFAEPARCTLLQTPFEASAGTALLVAPRMIGVPTEEQLHHCFDVAARAHGLSGAPYLHAPAAFDTSASAVTRRYVAGDGRAPVVIAGDAAQTGHVFTGQTCFVNLALALRLAGQLERAKTALSAGEPHAPAVGRALAVYDHQSEIGAAILARASHRHTVTHATGAWALAGVAKA